MHSTHNNESFLISCISFLHHRYQPVLYHIALCTNESRYAITMDVVLQAGISGLCLIVVLRLTIHHTVATVNNGVLAVSRIVNCNRSTNALITLTLQFQVSATGDQLELFREAVDKFVEDRPRLWEQVVFFRCDKIDQNIELIECTLRVQHRKAWQDAGSIMMNQSELLKFCYEMGKKLDINYNRFPPPQRVFTWYESVKESSLSLDEVITSPGLSKRFASKEEKAQPDRATSRVFDEFLRQEVEK